MLDDGLVLKRVVCPIGVLLIIFEARPEVVVQISSLCIKSGKIMKTQGLVIGNAVILKGGKEGSDHSSLIIKAHQTNSILVKLIQSCLLDHPNAVQYIYDRAMVDSLLKCDRYLSMVIPRGSKELVNYVKRNTTLPVLGHADGICSMYLHSDADLKKAVHCVMDAKVITILTIENSKDELSCCLQCSRDSLGPQRWHRVPS